MTDTRKFLKTLIDNFSLNQGNEIVLSTIYFKECMNYIHYKINLSPDSLSHYIWLNDPSNDHWLFQEISNKINESMNR